MALDIAEANAVSSKFFDKTMTQDVYEKSPFYVRLKSKGNVSTDGGTQITWPYRYKAQGKTSFVGPRQQMTYEQIETRTQAVLDWKYMFAHAMISWDETVKNSGKSQIVNLLSDKATEMREDMLDVFATALFATTPGANDISSLNEIVDGTTTYAGISYSDAPQWKAANDDGTKTELVLYGASSLSYAMNQATFGSDKPDLILTTRNLWSKFESLIEPQKRYYGDKNSDLGKAGFTTLQFHSADVVSDVYCTDAYMFGLDTKQFELRYHPKFNMTVSPWDKLDQAGYPYAMVKKCPWVGNLMCRQRRSNFKFSTLDYTI